MDEVGWNDKKNLQFFDAGEVDQGKNREGSEVEPSQLISGISETPRHLEVGCIPISRCRGVP